MAALRSAARNIIMPRWVGASPPLSLSSYMLDCKNALAGGNIPHSLIEDAQEQFDRHGVVLLRHTGLGENLAAMGKVAAEVMGGVDDYLGGANPRDEIASNVFDVGAPAAAHLHYHHEMAYIDESFEKLGFSCKASPGVENVGSTYLSDNVAATDAILKTKVGQKLMKHGVCYIRCLTDRDASPDPDGVYNHWQQSFQTEDPDEALELASAKGLTAEYGPGRYMRTKVYISAFEYFPKLDRNLLFSSIADDGAWFDSWRKVATLPAMKSFAEATPNERPLKMTYGNDEPISRDEWLDFVRVYDDAGFPVHWKPADILVFCNYRFAHGRPAYQLEDGQRRELGVTLGRRFKRVGDYQGKW